MYQKYLNLLIQKINETEISFKNSQSILNEVEFNMILQVFKNVQNNGNRVVFIGNGGSAAIAVHMTADFFKNGNIKTYSLYDSATITCLANDCGYENVFAKQLEMNATAGDLLVAISSSGNSPNIIRAVETAKHKEVQVITFSGFKENNLLRKLGDYNIYVPVEEYGIVESIHNLLLQQIVDSLMVMA